MQSELASIIALMNIKGIGNARARYLIGEFGSAKAVFEADSSVLMHLSVGAAIIEERNKPDLMARAEAELQFIEAHHIQSLIYGQPGYPKRLLDCPDAPVVLFYLGKANLDSAHIVAIVGTRSATQYGRNLVTDFVRDLTLAVPDVVIVSGLALGIDVTAHQAALAHQATTIGVVAHGLDQVYPSLHTPIARQMIAQGGGIITEYISHTEPERGNFLARNRIIAGLSDALLVAESKEKGGSLVTASIALDYNREVFAFPGRVGDTRSEGCNRLIRLNRAGLITCAQDFLEAMNWSTSTPKQKSVQHSIPFEEDNLSENGRLIMDFLRDQGDMLLSQLSNATGLDHTALYEELLDLEMDGKIRTTASGLYQLR